MKIPLTFKGNSHIVILYRGLVALILLSLSRMALYAFHPGLFTGQDFPGFRMLWIAGLRFDLSALCILLLPYIFFAALPFPVRQSYPYRLWTGFLFYTGLFTGLAVNMADTAYFPFNLKRMTWEVFSFAGSLNNLADLIPSFLTDFWLNFLVFFLFILFSVILISRVTHHRRTFYRSTGVFILWNSIGWILWMVITVIGIRGGFQLKPISLVTAGEIVESRYIPLALNTPFTLVKTRHLKTVSELHFFPDTDSAARYFNPVKKYFNPGRSVNKKNVIILIMESFSLEHSGLLNPEAGNHGKGYTPFLDSLMKEGLTFRAFANGKRSIEAIPAIVAGIPSLMPVDFIHSAYASQPTGSLAHTLKKEGYSTLFYHGGKNGTMRFDAYSRMAGFDQYKGKNEYKGPPADDGKWGIFDLPFFQFAANDLQQQTQPFLAVLFSLSSHHPYTVPDEWKEILPAGPLPIQQSIAYSDKALEKFFKTTSRSTWFSNTLFVITADHTSEGFHPYFRSQTGQYAIPLVFFSPGDSLLNGFQKRIAQQTDIYPSVVQYLNLPEDILAFGNSVFDTTTKAFSIQYQNPGYQFITGQTVIRHNGSSTEALYNFSSDSLLQNPVHPGPSTIKSEDELLLEAYLQQYLHRIIHNKLKTSPSSR